MMYNAGQEVTLLLLLLKLRIIDPSPEGGDLKIFIKCEGAKIDSSENVGCNNLNTFSGHSVTGLMVTLVRLSPLCMKSKLGASVSCSSLGIRGQNMFA